MIKVVIFLKRRADLAPERFQEHWRTRHAELIVRLPGIRRYVQNAALDAQSAYDGVAESSFDDTQAMKALARSPEYAAVLADEPNFIDRASMTSIITEEHLIKDGPAGGVKSIAFVKRAAGVPIDEFFRAWLERGALDARAEGLRRYVQCHTRRAIYDSGRTPPYDGVEMLWADSEDALPGEAAGAALRSPILRVSERVLA